MRDPCLTALKKKQNRLTKGILKKSVKHLSLKSTKGMHDATRTNYFSYYLHFYFMNFIK